MPRAQPLLFVTCHHHRDDKGHWFTSLPALAGPILRMVRAQVGYRECELCWPQLAFLTLSPQLLFLPATCIEAHSPAHPVSAHSCCDGPDSSQHHDFSKAEDLTFIKLEGSLTCTPPHRAGKLLFKQLHAELVWLKGKEKGHAPILPPAQPPASQASKGNSKTSNQTVLAPFAAEGRKLRLGLTR